MRKTNVENIIYEGLEKKKKVYIGYNGGVSLLIDMMPSFKVNYMYYSDDYAEYHIPYESIDSIIIIRNDDDEE